MRTKYLRYIFVVIFLCCSPVFASAEDDPPEAWDTYLDLKMIDGVLGAYLDQHPGADKPSEWISLDLFARQIPKRFRERLPVRDGWRNRFRVGVLDDHFTVASSGPDGNLDIENGLGADFSLRSYRSHTGRQLEIDDMILIVGRELFNSPMTTGTRQRITMADMRSSATAAESYAIDNNLYPDQNNGLQGLEEIIPLLEPLYILKLPLKDPWGNNYLYWSNEREYILISPGGDNLLDRDYLLDENSIDKSALHGAFDDPDTDIVFVNGQFVQWPRGAQR